MSAKKPASLSASLIARKVAVVPPRSGAADKQPLKPSSLSDSTIARKVAVVPAVDRPQPTPRRERKLLHLPDWRTSSSIAVLFAAVVVTAVVVTAVVVTAVWRQTGDERPAASGAGPATDITTVARPAEPPAVSAEVAGPVEDRSNAAAQPAVSAIAAVRSESAVPAPAKAPPPPQAPPGESVAAAAPPPPGDAPSPADDVGSAAPASPAVNAKAESQKPETRNAESETAEIKAGPEPVVDITPPPARKEIATVFRSAPTRGATPIPPTPPTPRSKPLAKPAYVVQLSAVKTVAGARRETRRLQRSLGKLLKGRRLQVQKALTRGRGTVYRVHLTGFPNRVGARNMCARIKAQAFNCLVKKR